MKYLIPVARYFWAITTYGLAFASSVASETKVSNANCCKAIQSAGVGHVLYAYDEQYRNRTASYWSVSAQMTPDCIVQPVSTAEVSKTVRILVADAACVNTNFAIRGGGHMPWAGSNNIDHGITIDLGLIHSTTLDLNTEIASVGSGSRWAEVYAALEPHGVTVVGGRTGSVGVAGFLMGGGNSFYTAEKGFACDTVVNFEVVLATGEVVNANAKDNSDLFQVLKGGSGTNFGIITRFDIQAFKAGKLWGGTKMYPASVSQQQIEAHHAWTENVANYVEGSAIIFWSYLPTVQDIVILAAYEDTTGNVSPPGFDKFMAINATASTMRIASHKELTDELEQPTGYRNIWYTLTFKNNIQIYEKIIELHEQFVQEWKTESYDPDFVTQCMFQAIPPIFSRYTAERGGNVLGLDEERENLVLLLFDIAVKTPELEVLARKKLRKFGEAMKLQAARLGGAVDWTYSNYADGHQNPMYSLGAKNVAKMAAAAIKYDPKRIFQTRVPGGFKISQVQNTMQKSEL